MKRVAVIGLGTMGLAMQERLQPDFEVIGIGRDEDSLATVQDADVAILAVKPQSFKELAPELQPCLNEQLVISIMAGISIGQLTESLGTERVVRTMPNLALASGQSLTAWYTKTPGVGVDTKSILDTWGSSLELESEKQFDAFTALAGSGPAYFFQLAHLLEQTAMQHGFSAEQARLIGVQTFLGAASVMDEASSPQELVQRVASKGGTTEAALQVFEERGLGETVSTAVEAACVRSRQLGQSD